MFLKIKNWFIEDYLKEPTDFYEKAKIIVNYNFLFSLVVLLFLAAIIFSITGDYSIVILNISGGLTCLAQLFFLKKFRNVELSSKIFVIVITIQTAVNLFSNNQVIHFGTPLWMTIIILFAVFNLGLRWGLGLTGVTVLILAVFAVTKSKSNIEAAAIFPDSVYYSLIIEFLVAFSVILYLISVFLKTSRKAEDQLRQNFEELKKKNDLIHKQHEEKIVLIKEIHHRVKNNLQVISSLIRLKSKELKDTNSLKAFEEAQQRIIAMALIHERMYKLKELSKIEIEEYIRLLALDLIRQHSTTQDITLEVDIKIHYIGPKSIVPMGLILNEMICNSIRHGIEKSGIIQITGKQLAEGIELKYGDTGKGFISKDKKGFGLDLIDILTEQLNGKLEITSEIGKGSNAHFTFPFLN